MASINQKPAKQLGEILQDQQEPFTLQLYLIERGYTDSSNSLNKPPASSATNKMRVRVVIPTCTKILRAVFSRLASINLRIKSTEGKNQDNGITKMGKGRQNAEERISSASTTTVFHSCSESDIEDEHNASQKGHVSTSTKAFYLLIKGEDPTDRNFPWTCEQENKQRSPVSVLEVAALSDETSPVHNMQQNVNTRQEAASTITTKRFTGDSISLASPCKLLDISLIDNRNRTGVAQMHDSISSDFSSQYKKIKMALQQTKQLLFDCMREVTETQRWKDARQQQQRREFVGPEDLGKLLCENIWTWSRQPIVGTNSTQPLCLEEWSGFEQQRKEIAMEIGEFILEDITNVIVAEMMPRLETEPTEVQRRD